MHLAALQLVIATLRIVGAPACPTQEQVSAELGRVAVGEERPESVVRLARSEGALEVELLGAEGPVAEKRLPLGSCRMLARRVALLVAAWEGRLRADVGPPPELGPEAPAVPWTKPRLEAPAATVAVATIAPIEAPKRAEAGLPARPAVGIEAPRERPVHPWSWGVSAALAGSVTSDGAAPAGLVSVTVAPKPKGFGLKAGLAAEGARQLSVGNGNCLWQRTSFLAGLVYRLPLGGFRLGLGVDGWLALLTAQGVNFSSDQTVATANLGVGLDLMLSREFGSFSGFVGVWPTYWQAQRALVSGMTAEGDLPQLEALAGLGIGFGSN